MDRKALSERDICTRFITPAIAAGGWHTDVQMREEVNLTPPKAGWQPDELLYPPPKTNAWLQGLWQETAGWLRTDELGTALARLKC